MNAHVETIETTPNGVSGLRFVTAIIHTIEDISGDRITSRYLVQFAPTFDQATGALNGAQETADGSRIVFITDLNATAESIMNTADLTADDFDQILPVIAEAWTEEWRDAKDDWATVADAQQAARAAATN